MHVKPLPCNNYILSHTGICRSESHPHRLSWGVDLILFSNQCKVNECKKKMLCLHTKHTTIQRHGWSAITMCFAQKRTCNCCIVTLLQCYIVIQFHNSWQSYTVTRFYDNLHHHLEFYELCEYNLHGWITQTSEDCHLNVGHSIIFCLFLSSTYSITTSMKMLLLYFFFWFLTE